MSILDQGFTYIDRDMSWIDFDNRVLSAADRMNTPLYERIRFLGISDTNLHEFYSVRYMKFLANPDRVNTKEELTTKLVSLRRNQYATLKMILKHLESYEVTVVFEDEQLEGISKHVLRKAFDKLYFCDEDVYKKDNYTPSQCITLMVKVYTTIKNRVYYVKLDKYPKLVELSENVYIPIEKLVTMFIKKVIPINPLTSSIEVIPFLPIMDTSFPVNNEYVSMITRVEDLIVRRRNAKVINLLVGRCSNEKLVYELADHISPVACSKNAYELDYGRYTGIRLEKEHYYAPFVPGKYSPVIQFKEDFHDLLLHHPFDSFSSVLDFLTSASLNERIKEIRIVLYRVAGVDSQIVSILSNAAKAGKRVMALIECTARFNEQSNIEISQALEEAGVEVYWGLDGIKIHSKFCVATAYDIDTYDEVVSTSIEHFAHISSGNYNEITAKIYTDVSFFTSDMRICEDLVELFDAISLCNEEDELDENGNLIDTTVEIPSLNYVLVSPENLLESLIDLIDEEIKAKQDGKECGIFIKVNALTDLNIVEKLEEAKAHQVPITIICRGPCSIVSGGSLKVKSVIGRFLEHSRIYKFTNRGNPLYYIGSSDLMPRNLERRVEILVPVGEDDCKMELDDIIEHYKRDSANSYCMNSRGIYTQKLGDVNAHDRLIIHASPYDK